MRKKQNILFINYIEKIILVKQILTKNLLIEIVSWNKKWI